MKRLGLFWKITLFVFAFALTCVASFVGYRFFNEKFGTYTRDHFFGETLREIRYRSGKVKLIDPVTKRPLTPKLDWVAYPHKNDTTIVFCLNGKRGYLNRFTGKITITPEFQHAWNFSEKLGAVVKNNRLGFINSLGDEVISCKYFYNPDRDKRIDFLFKGGYCTVSDSMDKHGLINKKGEWVINPQYDYINNPIKGFRIIAQNFKYGLMDKSLHWILPITFDNIVIVDKGFLVAKDGGQQLLDFDGKTILLPFVYDDYSPLQTASGTSDPEGGELRIASGYTAYEINQLWGILDPQGKIITKAVYSDIELSSKDRFSCKIGNFSITLNEKGQIVY